MSRSFGVKILLPMDKYNSDEVYAADERLEKVSSDQEDGQYVRLSAQRSAHWKSPWAICVNTRPMARITIPLSVGGMLPSMYS